MSAYHVQAKDGFQFLCLNGRFSKIWSHIRIVAIVQQHNTTHVAIYYSYLRIYHAMQANLLHNRSRSLTRSA